MKDWEQNLNTITNVTQLIAAAIVIFSFAATLLWVKNAPTKK